VFETIVCKNITVALSVYNSNIEPRRKFILRASLAQLLPAPALLFGYCSSTVARSRFSLLLPSLTDNTGAGEARFLGSPGSGSCVLQ
jgi:hypothetical protein